MKREALDYLVCPDCQVALMCQATTEGPDEVETGRLVCPQCKGEYPIAGGIPRFVTIERPLDGENVKTAAAFGWE